MDIEVNPNSFNGWSFIAWDRKTQKMGLYANDMRTEIVPCVFDKVCTHLQDNHAQLLYLGVEIDLALLYPVIGVNLKWFSFEAGSWFLFGEDGLYTLEQIPFTGQNSNTGSSQNKSSEVFNKVCEMLNQKHLCTKGDFERIKAISNNK
ncbi:MAG: hypothetical protein J5640_08725 [Bacteroidales bacterium]|nr:hypothetical protein [Bacteroidales bacterium]